MPASACTRRRPEPLARQAHRKGPERCQIAQCVAPVCALAVDDQSIDLSQPRARLAQWSGRQQITVAKTVVRVDDCDLDIAGQRQML
jgi:hypothetical protein